LLKRAIIIILITLPLFAFDANAWDDKDKPFFLQRDNLSHFVINGTISESVTEFAKNRGFSKNKSVFLGILSGVVFGVVKENIYDKNYSVTDMQSWAIGAILGAVTVSFTF